jgi:hypothetical protein
VLTGLDGELGHIQGMYENAVPEQNHGPGGAGSVGGGGGGAQAQGQAGGMGTGAAGGQGAPSAGSIGSLPQGMAPVMPAYQQQQARLNAMDTGAQRAIQALLTSGDPNMVRAGANLYQNFLTGQLDRAKTAAIISQLQEAMRQPATSTPKPEDFIHNPTGALPAAPGPRSEAEPQGPTGPVTSDAQRSLAPTAEAEPQRQYQTVPPTTVVSPPSPQQPSGRPSPAPIPGAGGPGGGPAGTASPGPQEPTAPAAAPIQPQAPMRIAQAGPGQGAGSPLDAAVPQDLRARGMTAPEYRDYLRAQANALNMEARRWIAWPAESTRIQNQATALNHQADEIQAAIMAGPKSGAEAEAQTPYRMITPPGEAPTTEYEYQHRPRGAGPSAPLAAAPAWDVKTRRDAAITDPPDNLIPPNPRSTAGVNVSEEQTKKHLDAAFDNFTAAQKIKADMGRLVADQQRLPPTGLLSQGPGFQARAAWAASYNTIAKTFGMPTIDENSVASAQDANKITTRLGFQLSRTLGAREAASVVSAARAATPGLENTPLGFKLIVAGINADAQHDQDWYTFLDNWVRKGGGYNMSRAAAAFDRMNPPDLYVKRAVREAGVPVMVQSPDEARTYLPGTRVKTPDGKERLVP